MLHVCVFGILTLPCCISSGHDDTLHLRAAVETVVTSPIIAWVNDGRPTDAVFIKPPHPHLPRLFPFSTLLPL